MGANKMDDKEKWLKDYELSKQEISCFNCKYYDSKQCVCMYNYSCICILNEDTSAKNCNCFKFGKFDENDLEDKDSIVGYLQY